MQKKKVLLITYGNRDHASSRVRGLNHFDRLKDVFDTTWIPRVKFTQQPGLLSKISVALSKRIQLIKLWWAVWFSTYDIVFVQVMFLPEWCLVKLKKKGAVICFDFDDAVYTYSKTSFDLMMQYTDKVIVATPYLMEYIGQYHKTAIVIFSPVDTGLIFPVKKEQPVFTIGWIGSSWTLPYLQTLQPVFETLAKKMDYKLLVQGAELNIPGVKTECIPWSEQHEIDSLAKIDVGIMPLENTEWAKMKGGYKLYLYMAAGKPAVASPFGINAGIVKEGVTGFLARDNAEWVKAFEKLHDDITLRTLMGNNARRDAEEKYSYEVCTKQLVNFLNS